MSTSDPRQEPGFGVYVHWPFCLAKCPYCDFNSHVRHGGVDEARFIAAYRREIAHMAAIAPGRTVTSVFFGGGTPSLMAPATVGAVLEAIAGAWTVAPGAEVTLEANPTSVEAERFRGYRAAGVNRVSLGVQAMNDTDLKKLGRMHTVAEAMAAVDIAARSFERYSFDLIYARPDQTPADWSAELDAAIARAAEHLSLYQLTIEPDTVYERLVAAGKLIPMPDEEARVLFDVTRETCEKRGLPAYEISNHARPGAESRHNLVYWRYGEYAGIGPGAHGRLVDPDGQRLALAAERQPEMWLTTVEMEGHGLVETQPLGAEEQGDEYLLMGLRLNEGIDVERFRALRGRPIDAERIRSLTEEGLIERVGNRVRVTRDGFALLDAVVADLAA
ncbi:radical SAM family heme chaperone HemW [Labrys wisconsinensis]|uniref:Heme chaperone HemW n=1 Tax=Labrys wisconsinensis TaxID=425677 RepID=A0ABU0J4P6_9HYPH|nr:radical SAM family heme chaperone HemW [Labrys wisconsinensis]MDQ0468152.1 oxygen-independent coproporphyrinogen-3 oxidase [Labrys wisconsinensis]